MRPDRDGRREVSENASIFESRSEETDRICVARSFGWAVLAADAAKARGLMTVGLRQAFRDERLFAMLFSERGRIKSFQVNPAAPFAGASFLAHRLSPSHWYRLGFRESFEHSDRGFDLLLLLVAEHGEPRIAFLDVETA